MFFDPIIRLEASKGPSHLIPNVAVAAADTAVIGREGKEPVADHALRRSESMALAIDIVSDVICPWCFIGKRRLEQAIRHFDGGLEFCVRWLPFQLTPDLPREGMDRRAYRTAKFGS